MNNNLRNELRPLVRSAHATSAQSVPNAPSAISNNGNPPAGPLTIHRKVGKSHVEINVNNHKKVNMLVADVDQGSEAASDIANISANDTSRVRLYDIGFTGCSASFCRESFRKLTVILTMNLDEIKFSAKLEGGFTDRDCR